MKDTEIKQIFNLMIKLFPDFAKNFNREIGEVWAECLQGIEYGQARKNVINHAKSSRFRPTIADVRGTDKKRAPDDWCEVTASNFKLVDFRRPEEGVNAYHP
jgi:hypothetical protein